MATKAEFDDKMRIRDILEELVVAWDYDEGTSNISVEQRLYDGIQPEKYPIIRRKLLSRKQVFLTGLWWMNESQWLRFLSPTYQGASKISEDRLLTTRAIEPMTNVYIRHMGDYVDVEASSCVRMWDPVKKRDRGNIREWLTVSVTKETFAELEKLLGEVQDCCKHNKD